VRCRKGGQRSEGCFFKEKQGIEKPYDCIQLGPSSIGGTEACFGGLNAHMRGRKVGGVNRVVDNEAWQDTRKEISRCAKCGEL
jgi:hypothetical protein